MKQKKNKRGQRQGSVTQRPNGKYMAQLPPNEMGRRPTKYFDTKTEANNWLNEQLYLINKGLINANTNITTQEYLEMWLRYWKNQAGEKALRQYTQIVKQHILPYLGKYKLVELKPIHINKLFEILSNEGKGTRTIQLVYVVFHIALNQAVKEDLLVRNPLDNVNRPKHTKKEIEPLRENEVTQFLISCRGHRLEALLKIAFTTGMRKGEILGLKWTDIDWEEKTIRVQRQLQRIPGQGLTLVHPKTSSSTRTIYIGEDTILALRKHSERQYAEQQLAGDKWQENGLVFPSRLGTPYDQGALDKEFKKLLQQANLREIRFHDIRHTTTSLLLKQGVPIKVVQVMLGHEDISTTLRTYSHVYPGMLEEAAKKMNDITEILEVDLPNVIKESESGLQYGCSKNV